MPPIQKPTVDGVLDNLAACFLQQLKDAHAAHVIAGDGILVMPAVVAVVPGEGVVPEYQGPTQVYTDDDGNPIPSVCGLGWVRLMQAYMATGVGVQDFTRGNCNKTLGFDINIGITRCYEPGDARTGPTADYLTKQAHRSNEMMILMLKAIQCCAGANGPLGDDDYIVRSYTPIGPSTMIGGSWTLSVAM